MKYIRTKDGIFGLSRFKFEKGDIDQNKVGSRQDCYWEQHNIEYCWHRCIWAKDIINQADTIEELRDELVYCHDIITEEHAEEILQSKEYICKEIYGAIWTDKGLIYVAKMNEKGELELL